MSNQDAATDEYRPGSRPIMRTHILALSIALAACAGEPGATDTAVDATVDGAAVDATIDALLIDAPTDAQIWPPANVGIEIGAAAAGDVDGDGRDDLLLAFSGFGHSASGFPDP